MANLAMETETSLWTRCIHGEAHVPPKACRDRDAKTNGVEGSVR